MGAKFRRKWITASEMKRNVMRATECGKEAWSINCELMNKNRIEGAAGVERKTERGEVFEAMSMLNVERQMPVEAGRGRVR